MKWFILLVATTFVWADVGQTYIDPSDQDYHSDISSDAPSSKYVDPKIRHLRQLYRQYTRRAFEYRGLAEKYYPEKERDERDHYAKLAKEYEDKAMEIAQQLQDIESGGTNPPSLSSRIERRRVASEKARIRSDEKEQVPCDLKRQIEITTWQEIPSSTGIGKFPNRASNNYYPGCTTSLPSDGTQTTQ